MSYSSTNPARVAAVFGLTDARQLFVYESTHAHTAVETAGFFTGCGYGSPGNNNAGMKVGDYVMNVNQSTAGTSSITWHRVTSISTSTGFGSLLNVTVSAASS